MNEPCRITEAEWNVMRVIWSYSTVTSLTIIEELGRDIGWSPTTVKTLLKRLVDKHAIGYEANKRTFIYHPIVTEEECVHNEIHMLFSRIYGGILNRETDHFLFYGGNKVEYIDTLAGSLESNCERILSDMQYRLEEKISVYIHPDLRRFHSAMGFLDAPDWLRAGWKWSILHIAPDECFKDLPADRIALHAFTEIIIHKINPTPPYWLHEGIAAYEAKWNNERDLQIMITSSLHAEQTIPLRSLSLDFRTFAENNGYQLAYSIVEYIVKTYGYGKLNILLRLPGSYPELFGCSEDEFFNEWSDYLYKKYGRKQ